MLGIKYFIWALLAGAFIPLIGILNARVGRALGEPIYAAAAGRVSYVGWKLGYGKTVEITHGNGLMTRYAHMSAFRAKVGERVEPGQTIGAIGSTGRSTGPHLHFEVRINNRAVNPRTFLETAPHVLEEIRRAPQLARAD